MKLIVVGDAYITTEMMLKGLEDFDFITEVKSFFFGENDRASMRNIVKIIESKQLDSLELPEGLLEEIKTADILMVHLCPVTDKLIESAKNLKYVLCNRGGIENINLTKLNERNIILVNNPAHNANAVAEFTVGLMISETRNIARSHYSLKNNVWCESFPNSAFYIRELKNLVVGIIGYGSVGRLVIEKLKSFGCEILVCDPFIELAAHDVLNEKFVTIEELVSNSDIVSIHARGNNAILTKELIDQLKSNSYIINTARPCLIDSDALLDALKNKRILGAAIDVFDSEPNIPQKYLELDNITLTNHRGGDTLESYSDSPKMMLDNLSCYFKKQNLKFWVNKKDILK